MTGSAEMGITADARFTRRNTTETRTDLQVRMFERNYNASDPADLLCMTRFKTAHMERWLLRCGTSVVSSFSEYRESSSGKPPTGSAGFVHGSGSIATLEVDRRSGVVDEKR